MIKNIYCLNIVVIFTIVIALVYSPITTYALPNREGKPGSCYPTGQQTGPHGAQVVKCCWQEQVPPGTGAGGTDREYYCQECEDGGTRGYVNCTDPELQYREGSKPFPPLSGNINDGQISDAPLTGNNDNPNLGIAPKGGLAGGIEDLQSNNNIIQATPESSNEDDDSTTAVQEQESNLPQTENASDSSSN
ncbi:MAG TPA: hypothetical protein VD815_09700 [Candidatus Saccharimonadales bacterium]|nr:hypothetical protein [Candidatus Saccharimonadales bacterium]